MQKTVYEFSIDYSTFLKILAKRTKLTNITHNHEASHVTWKREFNTDLERG